MSKIKIVDWFKIPKFRVSGEKLGHNCHVLDEVMDEFVTDDTPYEDELSLSKGDVESMVDLSSFRPRVELEPNIWGEDEYISSRVRLALLDIADDFIETLNIPWAKPKDIILTGSLANYNWSKYSDFDLHILYDFDDIDERTDFVKEYVDAKKNQWNNQHDELTIYGYPVEVYVQDINETHTASGVYSLEENEWLVEPNPDNIKSIKLNKYFIKEKARSFMAKIDALEEKLEETDDKHEISVIDEKIKALFDKLKGLRKESLDKFGEMGSGNIIYKLLRRTGYLDKILDLRTKTYDKNKSFE